MSTALSSRDVMVRLHLQGAPFVRADLAHYKPKTRVSTVHTCMIEDDAIVENFFFPEVDQNLAGNALNGNQIINDVDMDQAEE